MYYIDINTPENKRDYTDIIGFGNLKHKYFKLEKLQEDYKNKELTPADLWTETYPAVFENRWIWVIEATYDYNTAQAIVEQLRKDLLQATEDYYNSKQSTIDLLKNTAEVVLTKKHNKIIQTTLQPYKKVIDGNSRNYLTDRMLRDIYKSARAYYYEEGTTKRWFLRREEQRAA